MTENIEVKKEEKEEQISPLQFLQWKNSDCTKAMLKSLEKGLKMVSDAILKEVTEKEKIDLNKLYTYQGAFIRIDGLIYNLNAENARDILNTALEEKEEDENE